jgi:hypothetical protein
VAIKREKDKFLSVNYENIPISDDTLKGMSINIYDQQFLKRLNDRQDEINSQNIKVFMQTILEEFCCMTADIKKELQSIMGEISLIKDSVATLQVIAERNQVAIKIMRDDILRLREDLTIQEKRVTDLELHFGIKNEAAL